MIESRRVFLQESLGLAALPLAGQTAAPGQPWYRRCTRWGQTNITERDPVRYDVQWWRNYWKETRTQGVVINAGGIVAYYPSKYPLHHRAEFLGGRDLYGELAEAAHKDGLVVFARMDSNQAWEPFFKAHPDWFTRDSGGNPYRNAERYVSCVNSPYYDEYLPEILREIIERSHPEGFTDNSWSGLGRASICYCDNCERKFRARSGKPVPRKADWDDPVYREWIRWNYARRLEIWDLNNRVTKAAGGADCIWVGMNSSSVTSQSSSFRDFKGICERAEMIMLDSQRRSDSGTFQENGDAGKLVHGLLGWEKFVPESMAMYQNAGNSFRLTAKPAAEARMWMVAGFAGGLQPWWHYVGAYHEDRRMYRTAAPVMAWHQANEPYLVNREPVASVGLVWSQANTDFYGRDDAQQLVDLPFRGWTQALAKARIPYFPIHVDHIEMKGKELTALVLPDVAALSDAQCESVRRFVRAGGSLVATGVTSLCNEGGEPRRDFGLADLFGAHVAGAAPARRRPGSHHTYLRLTPELRAQVAGPKAGEEPLVSGQRHQVLEGFGETDILPFGGTLERYSVDPGAVVPLTFIPAFPVFPPETAWMREPKTEIPGLVLREGSGGRVAFLPADLDRRYAIDYLPDHAALLANLVRWACGNTIPLRVEGRGLLDCHLYLQQGRMVLHLVNLTSAGTWRAPIDELIPVGPFRVSVRLAAGVGGRTVSLRVAGTAAVSKATSGWCTFEVKSVLDHEVAVIA